MEHNSKPSGKAFTINIIISPVQEIMYQFKEESNAYLSVMVAVEVLQKNLRLILFLIGKQTLQVSDLPMGTKSPRH